MILDSDHLTFEEMTKGKYFTRLGNYINLSSLVLYLYYYITTLDSEISVMWNAGFGLGKLLFYSLRYFSLLYVISTNIELYLANVSAETLVFIYFLF
ncbi:hypothetical protein PNOK_0826700 [Pyrrhoderma noxium]|uniref:DUF6533 domain-containing protein n=1 Tax=Pyrrhoderma noxium TaxID=2282107 RepID=A0A286UAQ5_9AGAM|nr:hypothetical protein PNOK_0826700 [Pyrrhoderma noxium]